MAYLYGTYAHLADSVAQATNESSTVVLYVGTAPINLVRGYAGKNLINTPLKINNLLDAQTKLGSASDWSKYSLCEAVAAHFGGDNNIGPIYVINVLNPATHRKGTATTKNLTFVNGKASFVSEDIILDTFALADKAEGTDYILSYNFTTHKVTVLSADESDPLTGTIAATYNEIDVSGIDEGDIIGTKSNGVYTGLQAAELIYQNYGAIVNLYGAPGWSDKKSVYDALCNKAVKLNGHWDGFVYADIPLSYNTYSFEAVQNASGDPSAKGYYELDNGEYVLTEDDEPAAGKTYYERTTTANPVDTISKAVNYKSTNGFTSERSKVFWPKGNGTDGNIYHLSTLALAETLRLDLSHNGVPMETCGNKPADVNKQYFGAGVNNAGYAVDEANELCENGIDTIVFWGGSWKLWGDHTAAYTYANTELDPRDIFDVNMRMLLYLTNSFQARWAGSIDKPMTVQLKDTILVREQEKLDALVAAGALIGSPTISFNELNNPIGEIRSGNFRWDVLATPTPPLKSASAYVAYTDEGFAAYFD